MTSENTTPTPARRRFGPGALVLVAILSAALGVGGNALVERFHDHGAEGQAGGATASAAETWQCPMHPTIVQDHPGKCPICGMDLVKLDAAAPAGGAQAGAGGERKILFYRNPHDPNDTSHEPKKDQMGMDFIPVYSDEVGAGGGAGAPAPEGLATVNIDPARQQLIGLRTAPVEKGPVGSALRTNGRITPDETRVHHVNLKVGGYVTGTNADFVGQPIKKGEPLFTFYSPDLLAAQEEYLLALRTRERLRQGGASEDGDALVESARRKLELWDIPASAVERLERTGKPVKDVTFYAPATGVITKRDAVPGMRVEAGAMPIEMVDLSRVWVQADVYESELRHVKVGVPATLSLKAYPNRTFKGRVSFIAPQLDPKTRTVAVRLEFPNPTGELKPEMFGEVTLQSTTRKGLRIPSDAVIDSGTESVVFVALGGGKFEPRTIEVGDAAGAHVEVVKGLSEGEQVVTRANFLIDSESRLKASLAAMSAPKKPDGARAGTPSSAPPSDAPPPRASGEPQAGEAPAAAASDGHDHGGHGGTGASAHQGH